MSIDSIKELSVSVQNEYIQKAFLKYFGDKGYIEGQPQKITSRVDKSVYFIGSTISVLKPFFLEDKIPDKGIFLIQRAIRTQGLKNIYNDTHLSEWTSYFRAMGILTKYKNVYSFCHDVWNFFYEVLKIEKENMIIRACKQDEDLLQYWIDNKNDVPQIEIDTKHLQYYRHKYGLDKIGIFGRNINLAIRANKFEEYKDIGNIIVIESESKKYGVEAAFGLSNLISKINGFKNSIEGDLIAQLIKFITIAEYRFGESITVVTHLIHERLKPSASDTSGRLLRGYIKALGYWADILKISDRKISYIANEYEKVEYKEIVNVGNVINLYLKRFKED